MNRRTFLRRTSAFGLVGLAGCTSEANDGGDGNGSGGSHTPESSPTDSPTATDTPTPPLSVTDYGIRTVDASCKSGDVTVSVHRGESAVTISGLITASNPCYEAVLNAVSYSVDNDTLRVDVGVESTDDACVDCVGAVEYEATVEFANGLPATVTVSHQGEVVETGDGDASTGTASDAPTLVDSSLSVTDISSSQAETTADVEFDSDAQQVFVTGTIRGNNGCKTAALGDVAYDTDEDSLSVDVVTTDREDADACTQQLVYISYEATISFDGGVPASASVSHDGDGVMSAGHDSASASAPDDQS